LCGCGQRGHLEALASGPAISRYVQEQLANGAESTLKTKHKLTAKDISEAASKGDILAIHALERAGTHLGLALATFVHIFNPSVVIFGGGVSFSGKFLLDPVKASLEKHVMDKSYLNNLLITNAELGDNAGLMGALALGLLPDN
jgi:glucokinase